MTPHCLRAVVPCRALGPAGAVVARDVVTVQRVLGHSRATTTLNTYSHLWPTAEGRTRNAAQAMLDEAMGETADFLRTDQGS